jgi:hypothetical protein
MHAIARVASAVRPPRDHLDLGSIDEMHGREDLPAHVPEGNRARSLAESIDEDALSDCQYRE